MDRPIDTWGAIGAPRRHVWKWRVLLDGHTCSAHVWLHACVRGTHMELGVGGVYGAEIYGGSCRCCPPEPGEERLTGACWGVSRRVGACRGVLWCVTTCCHVSWCVMACHCVMWGVMARRVTACCCISWCVMACRCMLWCVMACCCVSWGVVACQGMSWHV